jgi:hypothetical protein
MESFKKNPKLARTRIFLTMIFSMGAVMLAVDTIGDPVRRYLTTKENLFDGVCPALVNKKKGIYTDESKRDGFNNTVLITASNHQFLPFYRNWKLLADEHGLQHVVISLDQETHDKNGPDSSILLPSGHQVASAGSFRSASYNTVVCNKIRMVLEILDTCNVNVVFSDADNVFIKDPFQHDLGAMIKSNKLDYIYQSNAAWTDNAREHRCTNSGVDRGGNTGFHFMKPTQHMKDLLQATLDDCDAEENRMDDQTLLWKRLDAGLRNGTAWGHCPSYDRVNGTSFQDLEETSKARLCCLDPHFYPTGLRAPNDEGKKDLVSLHANYQPVTIEGKIEKLHSFSNGAAWRLPREA